MNMVGKIFVVLVTLMSFVFMAMALTVYATHQNWRMEIERTAADVKGNQQVGLKYKLEQANQLKQTLQAEYDTFKKQVAEEKLAQRQVLAKLESQYKEVSDKRDDLQKERDTLNAKDQESVAALDTATKTLAKLTDEVEGLRKEIRLTQAERDKQFRQVVELTDSINKTQNELKRVQEREQQVARQVAVYKDYAKKNPGFDVFGDQAPTDLHGKVLAISGEELVEVSIGKDDGLKVGNTLEVFRGSNYLGRVEVVKIDSDRAVAKILRDFKRGIIQKGDDVASRLKLG